MLIDGHLGMESLVTGLALERRLPVSRVIHMLICRALGKEFSIACVAFVSWAPVVECVHVLDGSLLATKLALACLTLIVIVHVELVSKGCVKVQSGRLMGSPGVVESRRGSIECCCLIIVLQQARGVGLFV